MSGATIDAPQYVRGQVAAAHRLFDSALQDATDDQLHWSPPGTANSVGAVLLHAFTTHDRLVNVALRGGQPLWEEQDWAQRLGLGDSSTAWDAIREANPPLAPLLEYWSALKAAAGGYLDTLTAEELDREVTVFRGPRPAAEALSLLVTHTLGHAGEVAALRGMQGVKGLPF